jgi:serine/threonine protein kinase
MKNETIISIIPDSEEELFVWIEALRPLVLWEGIWDRYSFSKEIGQGSYGKVYLAKRETKDGSNSLGKSEGASVKSAELGSGGPKGSLTESQQEKLVAVKVLKLEKIVSSDSLILSIKNEISMHWILA